MKLGLDDGVRGLHVDSAHTAISLSSVEDSDVSLLSPGLSPGVSDDPVVLGVVNSVSDDGNSVVEGGGAGRGDDSALVGEEGVGVNGDGDDGVSSGGLEVAGAVGGHVVERGNLGDSLTLLVGTGLVSGLVGVVGLGLDVVDLHVLEAVVHPTSVASVVSERGGAVDQLLLGEAGESVSGDLVGSLSGSDLEVRIKFELFLQVAKIPKLSDFLDDNKTKVKK